MKIQRKCHPLLLLLTLTINAVAAEDLRAVSSRGSAPPGKEASSRLVAADPIPSSANANIKLDPGTKDAPVDGKDGKPHAGPWVESGSDKGKEAVHGGGEITSASRNKPSPRPISASIIPEVNDGVMDDLDRVGPKKGTTGTEGGVSEKDRSRKAHEGQTGEKPEKMPDPPREAPPLPHSEVEKIKVKEGVKKDFEELSQDALLQAQPDGKDTDEIENLGGLAVSYSFTILWLWMLLAKLANRYGLTELALETY